MIALAVAVIAAAVLIILIVIAVMRYRAVEQAHVEAAPRRAYELEARIRSILVGPTQKYGKIFVDYSVWKSERETRLELVAGDPWKELNEFTRCLVVRYLWRVLESLSGGSVVVVDSPSQRWNEQVDAGFHDQGFDWKTFGQGPQFIKE